MLTGILESKDQRQSIRQEYATEGYATVSLNLNIPGYPKSGNSIRKAFFLLKEELHNYLLACRIAVYTDKITVCHDEAGDICFFPVMIQDCSLQSVKNDLEAFEEKHSLGRLVDVDLFAPDHKPVSSGKRKTCFLCDDKPAVVCMREKKHTYEELKSYVVKKIGSYIESERKATVCHKLSELAGRAILTEISLPGKPGLVCPESRGSHTDMDYLTFINSSSAISTFFEGIAAKGYEWDGTVNRDTLHDLRTTGLKMEQAMFRASNGINTQKGIIFLMGFSLFAAAHVIKKEKTFDINLFRTVLKMLNRDVVKKELCNGFNRNISHGEICFGKYGKEYAGGIRRETEAGLPTVFEVSIPLLNDLFNEGINKSSQEEIQDKLLRVLVKIMSVNNDTNILYRSDISVLDNLKEAARNIDTGEGNIRDNPLFKALTGYCLSHNISPGGSADLLAVTLFVYYIINEPL